jgi:hypothetical protein
MDFRMNSHKVGHFAAQTPPVDHANSAIWQHQLGQFANEPSQLFPHLFGTFGNKFADGITNFGDL